MRLDKTNTDIKNKLSALAKSGKLTCADAHKFAEAEGVSLVIVGGIANEIGVKISDCQLGCFGKHKEN